MILKQQPQADPYESMRQRLYEAQCLKCQDNVHAAQQEFDKAILTLSAGLLGISLAFIKDIVPLEHAFNLSLLYASWVFAVVAMILTLLSFLASKHAFNAQLQRHITEYADYTDSASSRESILYTECMS